MKKAPKKSKPRPSSPSVSALGAPVSDIEIFKIAGRLCAAQDLDVLLKEIGRVAEALTEAEASSLLLLDEDGQHLHFKTASGEKGQAVKRVTVPIDQGIAGWVARQWKPLLVPDVSRDERFLRKSDAESGFVTRSVLAVPMVMGDQLVGVCEVINKRVGDFSDQDRETLQNLANFAAVAIANAQIGSTTSSPTPSPS